MNVMPPVIGLAGYMRSGKSTAAAYLVGAHGFVGVNFADALRDAVAVLDPIVCSVPMRRYAEVVERYGYDQAKDMFPEVRRLLQVLGTEVGRNILGPDVWVDAWRARIAAVDKDRSIVVADVRFPNEAEDVKVCGELWWIGRPGCEPSGHASEHSIGPGDCDTVIANTGTLDELHRKVDAWLA